MPYESESGLGFFDVLNLQLERLMKMDDTQTEWEKKQLELFHAAMIRELERPDLGEPMYSIYTSTETKTEEK